MKIEMIGLTDTGVVREHNEDDFVLRPEDYVAVLADGMGGHQAGEVASQLAVDVIAENVTQRLQEVGTRESAKQRREALRAATLQANADILQTGIDRPECLGMGATVVAVTFGSDGFTVMHLGDSRLYRLRAGKLFQLTEDHSVVQEFIRQGVLTPEEARLSINKNLVTRALGIEENPEPEFTDGDLSKGDLYLLCSDGLTDVVQDEEIQKILAAEKDLEAAAGALIDAANEGGGPDNITVVLARVSG